MAMSVCATAQLRFSRAILLIGLALSPFANAGAVEIVVRTDSLPPASSTRLIGFGDIVTRMGTLLESPVDGVIVGVQVLWESPNGDAPPSLQPAIRISTADPDHRMPYVTLATINTPTLQDVGVNEFRFLDPGAELVPLAVPVSAGMKFCVDLEIFPSEDEGPSVPGLLLDADGTQGFNMALIEGRLWVGFSIAFTGGGDLGLRAIIRPVPEPSTYALAAMGVVALLAVKRRKHVS